MKPAKKWVLGAILALPALLALKVGFVIIAEPRATVDYAAEFNQICRPENYDPSQDAASDYKKAFEGFVYMPRRLSRLWVNWPGDFSNSERALLERWLLLNSQTFDHFRAAASKPYCWLERREKEDNNMFSIMLPELIPLGELAKAVMWWAKLEAMNGEYRSAFRDIINCYRVTRHKCSPNLFLTTQHTGLGIRKSAIQSAFVILDRSKIGKNDLEFFQNVLQSEIDGDSYIPDIEAEKFFVYDVLQQTFIYNGRGTGRLAWSAGVYHPRSGLKRQLEECFLGPTRNDIVEQTEAVLAISSEMMDKTPWQIESDGHDYLGEIESINNSNSFLQHFGVSPEVTFHLYHTTGAQTEALVAVLAILRFKADAGRFPEALDELVTAGYLRSVPMDPYSGEALVYRIVGDDFELYSVGEDFLDNGGPIGTMVRWFRFGKPRRDRRVYSRDIIYWPVNY